MSMKEKYQGSTMSSVTKPCTIATITKRRYALIPITINHLGRHSVHDLFIGTLAKGGWILYVAVALSGLLTRVSPSLIWISHLKWLIMVIYEYNQYTQRLYCLYTIQLFIISEWFLLHSVLLVKKQIKSTQRQSFTFGWLSVCSIAFFNI